MNSTALTKSAFATIAGMTTRQLSVYIGRGKVIVDGELIDPADEVNEKFLQARLNKMQAKNEQPVAATEEPGQDVDSETVNDAINAGLSLTELTRQQKVASLEKTLKEVELLKLKTQKINAELIPVAMVKDLVSRLGKGLAVSYKDAWEYALTSMSVRHRFTGEDLAEYRGRMIHLINEAHERGVNIAKKDIQMTVEQFKETRTRGEKK